MGWNLSSVEHPGIELPVNQPATAESYAEAARVAARLLPRLTDIVRTSAGDNGLRVSINQHSQGPCTDGATVHLPLDPGFADIDPDNPCVCDEEPESCLYHITVGVLLHEAAHISQGSTKPVDVEFCQRVELGIAKLMEGMPEEFSEAFIDRHDDAGLYYIRQCVNGPRVLARSGLEVASWFNPDAPLLANAFEDARINKAVGDSRSALGQQMARLAEGLVVRAAAGEGIVEGPVGYQVGVAVNLEVEHDLDLKPVLKSETVLACLNDPNVKRVLDKFKLETTAEAVAAGIVLAEYARETYGLFESMQPEQTGEDTSRTGNGRAASQPIKSGKDLGDDGKLKESQRLRDKKKLEQERSELVARSDRSARAEAFGRAKWTDRGADKPVESLEPVLAEIQAAMNESRAGDTSEHLDDLMQMPGGSGLVGDSGEGRYVPLILRPDYEKVPVYGDGVKLLADYKFPAGGGFDQSSDLEVKVQAPVHKSQRKLADALGMNRRSASTPNLVRGRLHGSKLARVPTGNRRAFRRIDKPRKRSYAVLIGVDQSGSTLGDVNEYLVELAYAQATLLARLGIAFAVAGHTGGRYLVGEDDHNVDCDPEVADDLRGRVGSNVASLATIQLVKNFAEPWDEAAKSGVASLHAAHQNLDGLTMRTYIDMLCTQRATDRILLYYTDGAMPAEDHDNQRVMLEAQCRRAKAMAQLPDRRLHVVGVGVGTDSPKEYGLDTIAVNLDDTEAVVVEVVEGLADRISDSIRG